MVGWVQNWEIVMLVCRSGIVELVYVGFEGRLCMLEEAVNEGRQGCRWVDNSGCFWCWSQVCW